MHIPVMLEKVLEILDPGPGKTMVDCTLGFGGHAAALLARGARVIGIDQDQDALNEARKRFQGEKNITCVHDNFSNPGNILKDPVDGFLFDLGVSSYQIDEAKRGFSIRQDGPLDMRMDQSGGKGAAFYLNTLSQDELAGIFAEYGEERFSKRIARMIGEKRKIKEIETTFELKEIIEKAIPTWRKRESVTRIFQALRIYVNSELENLKKALTDCIPLLNPGGRIAVISYHSLEDRIVKWFFIEQQKSGILKVITKKPWLAGAKEIEINPRAKSAKLRGAEKI